MAPLRVMRAAARRWPSAAGAASSTSARPPASGPRRRCPSTRWRRRPSSRSRASSPTATPRAACSSTRSAPARSNRRCGWSPAACSTSRRRCRATPSREEALATAGSKRPIGRLAEVGRDRRRDRLPLLRARLLRQRRRLVGGRRHRPSDHLSRPRLATLSPSHDDATDGRHSRDRGRGPAAALRLARDDPGSSSPSAAPTCAATPARSRSRAAARTPSDADLSATALREAEEEIGLDPAAVELGGALPPTNTFVTGYRIHPFVGRIPAPARARPPAEPGRGRDRPHLLAGGAARELRDPPPGPPRRPHPHPDLRDRRPADLGSHRADPRRPARAPRLTASSASQDLCVRAFSRLTGTMRM